MKKLTLVNFLLILTLSACSSLPNKNKVANKNNPFKDQKNIKVNKPVNWTGYVLNTFDTSTNTCLEIVETNTKIITNLTDIYNKSKVKFIACQNKIVDHKKYTNSIVNIQGTLVSFMDASNGKNSYVYPIVKTDSLKELKSSLYVHNNKPISSVMSREPYDLLCNGSNCTYRH